MKEYRYIVQGKEYPWRKLDCTSIAKMIIVADQLNERKFEWQVEFR